MVKQKEDKDQIKDIYNGEVVCVWGDKEYVSIAFPFCTIDIPREVWVDVKKDFEKIGEL
jgi:hypothetical protein